MGTQQEECGMKYIDADILRKEIKRLEKTAHKSALGCADSEIRKFHEGKDFAYQHVGMLIDSLQQEPENTPSWKKIHVYEKPLEKGDMEKMLLDLSVGEGEKRTSIALPDRAVNALQEPENNGILEQVKHLPRFEGKISAKELKELSKAGTEWAREYKEDKK